jgi:cyclopropane-fatty-acyl-phospholipid synthase
VAACNGCKFYAFRRLSSRQSGSQNNGIDFALAVPIADYTGSCGKRVSLNAAPWLGGAMHRNAVLDHTKLDRTSSEPGALRYRGVAARTLRRFLRLMGDPAVAFELWNGTRVIPVGRPVATLRIKDAATLGRFMFRPEMGFGEAYVDGRIEVDGSLVDVLDAVYRAPVTSWAHRILSRGRRPRHNSRSGSRDNIHAHYDLGNDFYRLWLDERMVYTCAYYPTPDTTLAAAQVAKLEHVSRKLALRPGERVVEAGCGWGALALHMARHHGVRVRAFNISSEQIAYAREQAAREGLTQQVEFVEDDYRNIGGTYDAFVSIGMLEHVGVEHYAELGRVIDRCLPAHGRGLLHTIGRNRPARLNAWVEKHIFPGGYPPTLGEMRKIFEPFDFSVLDVENLRLHYEKTAAAWLGAFEQVTEKVAAMFDERFVRGWRLYLSGTTVAFRCSLLQLFQVVFARGRCNEIPWTRAYVYGER